MKKLTYIGALSALTYILTVFVKIPLLNQGYVNAGSIVIVITACLLGPVAGGLAGAIGSGIADLFVAPVWLPYTLAIKFILGYCVGTGVKKTRAAALLLYLCAGIVYIGGYYAAEAVIMGNWLVPIKSTPALLAEYIISVIIGLFAAAKLQKYKFTF